MVFDAWVVWCGGTQNMRASQVKPVRQMYVELMITFGFPAYMVSSYLSINWKLSYGCLGNTSDHYWCCSPHMDTTFDIKESQLYNGLGFWGCPQASQSNNPFYCWESQESKPPGPKPPTQTASWNLKPQCLHWSYEVSSFFSIIKACCQGCKDVPPYLDSYPPCDPNLQSPKVFWLFGFRVSSVKLWHPGRKPCRVVGAPLLLMKPCPPLLISLTKTPKIPILSFSRPSCFRVLANLPGCTVVQCLQLRHVVFIDSAICTGGHQHAIIGSPRHRTHLQQMCEWKLQVKKTRNNNTVVK